MTTLSPKLKVGHSWTDSLDRDSERGHNRVFIDGNQNLFDSTNLFINVFNSCKISPQTRHWTDSLDGDCEHDHVRITLMTSSNQMNGNCKPLTFD